MSRSSVAGLAAAVIGSAIVIVAVHWDQHRERRRMEEGLLLELKRARYRQEVLARENKDRAQQLEEDERSLFHEGSVDDRKDGEFAGQS